LFLDCFVTRVGRLEDLLVASFVIFQHCLKGCRGAVPIALSHGCISNQDQIPRNPVVVAGTGFIGLRNQVIGLRIALLSDKDIDHAVVAFCHDFSSGILGYCFEEWICPRKFLVVIGHFPLIVCGCGAVVVAGDSGTENLGCILIDGNPRFVLISTLHDEQLSVEA